MATPAAAHALHKSLWPWLQASDDQGLALTDAGLNVRLWNRWLEARTGRSAAEVAGRPLLEALPALGRADIRAAYEDVLRGPEPRAAQVARVVLWPGASGLQEVRITALGGTGAAAGTATVVRE